MATTRGATAPTTTVTHATLLSTTGLLRSFKNRLDDASCDVSCRPGLLLHSAVESSMEKKERTGSLSEGSFVAAAGLHIYLERQAL